MSFLSFVFLCFVAHRGKIPGPGHRVEIGDSIELCIVESTRVDCIYFGKEILFYTGKSPLGARCRI